MSSNSRETEVALQIADALITAFQGKVALEDIHAQRDALAAGKTVDEVTDALRFLAEAKLAEARAATE